MKIKLITLLLFLLTGFFVSVSCADVIVENDGVKTVENDNIVAAFYLWRQINELRRNPVQTMTNLGLDVENIREQLGTQSWILDRSLKPLALDLHLYSVANNHIQDMKINKYFGYTSPIDPMPLDVRVAQTGYMAKEVGESLGALSFKSYLEFIEAANIILANMIKDELLAFNPHLRLFSDVFTEIGVSMELAKFTFSEFTFSEIPEIRAYVVVVDYAKPVNPRSYVIGNVMKKVNDGSLFSPDDTLSGFIVEFRDVMFFGGEQVAETPFLGAYQFLRVSPYYMTLTAVTDLYLHPKGENSFWDVPGNLLEDIVIH